MTVTYTTQFSAAQVHKFVEATGDDNPLHQGDAPVVPAFLLVLWAKGRVEAERLASPSALASIEFRCKAPARADEKITVSKRTKINDESTYFSLIAESSGIVRLEATLRYGPLEPRKRSVDLNEAPIQRRGFCHVDAETVAQFTSRSTFDYQGLALGTLSHALLSHGSSVVRAQAAEGRYPVYACAEITLAPEIAQLGVEDVLITRTAMRKAHELYRATTVANAQDRMIYEATALLSFVKKAELAAKPI